MDIINIIRSAREEAIYYNYDYDEEQVDIRRFQMLLEDEGFYFPAKSGSYRILAIFENQAFKIALSEDGKLANQIEFKKYRQIEDADKIYFSEIKDIHFEGEIIEVEFFEGKEEWYLDGSFREEALDSARHLESKYNLNDISENGRNILISKTQFKIIDFAGFI